MQWSRDNLQQTDQYKGGNRTDWKILTGRRGCTGTWELGDIGEGSREKVSVGGSGQAAHPGDPRLEIDWRGGRQVVDKAGRILILQQLDDRQVILESKSKLLKHQVRLCERRPGPGGGREL